MKNSKFYVLLMTLFVGMVAVSSCSDDDDKDGNSDRQESGDVNSFDQLKYFQDNIVELDSAGNLVQRVHGAILDDSEPKVLYVSAEDFAAADSMFKSWLSPDTQVSPMSGSTTDLQTSLKDSTGTVKNTIYFKKVEEPSKSVAEITFANEEGAFNSKYCTKVVFYKSSAWPENEKVSSYVEGNLVPKPTSDEGWQKWVCIRTATESESGILAYISEKRVCHSFNGIRKFSNVALAKTASKIIRSKWSHYEQLFKEAGRTLEKSTYYWINEWKYYVMGGATYAIRLSDGDIDWFEVFWKNPHKPYLQVEAFGLTEL
jgi:hypothetical protein